MYLSKVMDVDAEQLHAEMQQKESAYLQLAQRVCQANPIHAIIKQPREKFQPTFSHLCKEFDITSQNNSGRCWIYSACNMLRISMRALMPDLPNTFELSQTYIFFYDKLEKANKFLHNIIETAHFDASDRSVSFLLSSPIPDGGQFNMFLNIIRKYGIVTKKAYGDTFCSDNSVVLNSVLTQMLRSCAIEIRESQSTYTHNWEAHAHKLRELCVQQVYETLVTCLGKPPCVFDFSYVIESKDSKNGIGHIQGKHSGVRGVLRAQNYGTDRNSGNQVFVHHNITPHEFVDTYVKLKKYMCLVNDPRNRFFENYKVRFLGNVHDKQGKYINVDVNVMLAYTKKALQNNIPVWFGADADKFVNKELGLFDENQFEYSLVFNVPKHQKTALNKKEGRLKYCDSEANHAMLFTGIDVNPDGSVNMFRIENSWGKEVGLNGYYCCTLKWFVDHVFLVAIETELIEANDIELQRCLVSKHVHVHPCWDPIGCLAD